MFTGIIQGLGTLQRTRAAGGGLTFEMQADFDLTDPVEGESIAINGVCLTAYSIRRNRFLADVSPETLSRSILGSLAGGDRVNLERALQLSDRLGGHIVSGHVDCVAELLDRRPVGDFTLFRFSIPEELSRYVIEKGSITINGISLTVNACTSSWFEVSIIPHTLQITSLGQLSKGGKVNIEVDIIGKYVEKLLGPRVEKTGDKGGGVSPSFLAEHGFF
ncbi:MAG: riboflavin synthase [Thermodesulfobacteriota bacterium]